ncbi:MAG: LacI family DNA-binding transcriptional regulator, partial [Cytophagales bacterium]|nr:LacI family DNA-binding transcriptional regulator [Armatimonadota bacterium]
MRQRETTIQDVAGAVGVSTATVSNILRGTGGTYAASTVEAVRSTARRLRYVPNAAARSLSRRQRTHMIGVVLTAGRQVLTRNAYFVQLLDGVLSAAMDRHYQVALISDAKENPNELHGYLRNGFVEGVLLFTPTPDSGVVEWAGSGSFPVVVAGSVYEGLACVDVDNEAAIRDAVGHLLERGHRRIGYIASYPGSPFTITRLRTYREAMRAALGTDPDPSWVFEGRHGTEAGAEGAAFLRRAHPDLTAYLCANDAVALSALRGL